VSVESGLATPLPAWQWLGSGPGQIRARQEGCTASVPQKGHPLPLFRTGRSGLFRTRRLPITGELEHLVAGPVVGVLPWLLVRQSDSTSSTAAFAGNDPSIALVLAKVTTGVELVKSRCAHRLPPRRTLSEPAQPTRCLRSAAIFSTTHEGMQMGTDPSNRPGPITHGSATIFATGAAVSGYHGQS